MTDYALGRFAVHVGERFDVAEVPGTTWILVEARGYGEVLDPTTHASFSLLFRGAPDPVVAQQIVTLRHPARGDQAIFVTPIGRDADGVTYQAVFN